MESEEVLEAGLTGQEVPVVVQAAFKEAFAGLDRIRTYFDRLQFDTRR
jgi:hypothetical protein